MSSSSSARAHTSLRRTSPISSRSVDSNSSRPKRSAPLPCNGLASTSSLHSLYHSTPRRLRTTLLHTRIPAAINTSDPTAPLPSSPLSRFASRPTPSFDSAASSPPTVSKWSIQQQVLLLPSFDATSLTTTSRHVAIAPRREGRRCLEGGSPAGCCLVT